MIIKVFPKITKDNKEQPVTSFLLNLSEHNCLNDKGEYLHYRISQVVEAICNPCQLGYYTVTYHFTNVGMLTP